MTSPAATRLGLAAQPENRSEYWNGVAILTLVAILALFVGVSFGPGQGLGVIFFFLLMPPGMWFLMGPWIIRHYANRLLDLRWPTALAPVAYAITSLTLLAGPAYLFAALPLGLPLGDERGGAVLPLLLGWAAASLAWLAFTIVIGCPPGNKAKAPEPVAA